MSAAQLHLFGAGAAEFSADHVYRYRLTRSWASGSRTLNVIGLNCSTATATVDDPTIRRCVGFAQRWGYGGLVMTNLFAYRATDPQAMRRAADPVGPENDRALLVAAGVAAMVLAAWGVHGRHRDRDQAVLRLLDQFPLWCLGVTKDDSPRHPLYVAGSTEPRRYA